MVIMKGTDAIRTLEELRSVLARLSFKKSCVDFAWQWEVEELFDLERDTMDCYEHPRGWLVNTTFRRPDTDTGEVGIGKGRQEFIAVGTTVSGVVKTCWLLVELITRHELMEAFLFDGARVFDPHKSVEELIGTPRKEPHVPG